jgi:predicted DNA-binding transcriptional regulator AlpA
MPCQLLSQAETAELLNLKPRTLERWRQKREGPPWVCYSARCVRYRRSEVLRWLAAHEVKPADRLAGPSHRGGNLSAPHGK